MLPEVINMKTTYFILGLFIITAIGFYFYVKETSITANVVKEIPVVNQTADIKDIYVKPDLPDQGIIRGKNVEQRYRLLARSLGAQNSGTIMKAHFPDIEVVYIDKYGKDAPYHYFYTKEGNATFIFNKNAISVAVCDGKVDKKIDLKTNNCKVKDYN